MHALADEGHLAKDGARPDGGNDQLFAFWRDAIELDAASL